MSKEAAAAILVQTLFTADKSMQNLVMSHAKIGTAEPKDVVAFILPYYREMLKAMDSEEGEAKNARRRLISSRSALAASNTLIRCCSATMSSANSSCIHTECRT